MTAPRPTVAVASSHVARGSVGNRAAAFALERLGFPVVAVPTVVLPFHPGHGPAHRMVPPAADFAAFLGDLAGSVADAPVGAVLTGYLGAADQARALAGFIRAVKLGNPDALYLLDPVLGDAGGLYRPQAVAEAIAAELLPLADIATPNRFELGFLGLDKAEDNAGLVAASRRLGSREVVVTSAFAPQGEAAALLVTPDAAYLAAHRQVAAAPHGVGDLLAALYLAARLDACDPPQALERAVAATLRMIERAAQARSDELPLAAAQDLFFAPPSGIAVTRIA